MGEGTYAVVEHDRSHVARGLGNSSSSSGGSALARPTGAFPGTEATRGATQQQQEAEEEEEEVDAAALALGLPPDGADSSVGEGMGSLLGQALEERWGAAGTGRGSSTSTHQHLSGHDAPTPSLPSDREIFRHAARDEPAPPGTITRIEAEPKGDGAYDSMSSKEGW